MKPERAPSSMVGFTEEGAMVVELILPEARFGFSLEVDPSESGWWMVSRRDPEAGGAGPLDPDMLKALRAFMEAAR